jgi:thymidylate synthase
MKFDTLIAHIYKMFFVSAQLQTWRQSKTLSSFYGKSNKMQQILQFILFLG